MRDLRQYTIVVRLTKPERDLLEGAFDLYHSLGQKKSEFVRELLDLGRIAKRKQVLK